ncbi:TIGR01621 family pseudouridine synthase [Paraglaciecola aestuariivivens]
MPAIDIVFENADFIVIDKPIGISVQNEQQHLGLLPLLYQQLKCDKLWLVHRLDKVTSGLLILAKSAESAALFGQLFEQKQVEKFYLAVSAKKPKKKQGAIKGSMKKVRDGKWMLAPSAASPAITQFFSFALDSGQRLFLLKPLTGKTHQIRVALKSLGSPILGDTLYKGITADRTYLHAFCLRFTFKDQTYSFCCLPKQGEVFNLLSTQQKLTRLTSPWTLSWPIIKPPLHP